jgi:hypothetical protein
VDAVTVNQLTSQQLSQWRRISQMNSVIGRGGKGLCPADQTILTRYVGEAIPPIMVVVRCSRCGKWWFPGDSLFSYKPAIEAKINFLRQWGITGNAVSLVLPVLTVAVLALGTVTGVDLVRKQQQANVAATMGLRELSVTYQGDGRGLVVFKLNQQIEQIEYKTAGAWIWNKAEVTVRDGYYLGNLTGLSEGAEYFLKVAGKEVKFTAK